MRGPRLVVVHVSPQGFFVEVVAKARKQALKLVQAPIRDVDAARSQNGANALVSRLPVDVDAVVELRERTMVRFRAAVGFAKKPWKCSFQAACRGRAVRVTTPSMSRTAASSGAPRLGCDVTSAPRREHGARYTQARSLALSGTSAQPLQLRPACGGRAGPRATRNRTVHSPCRAAASQQWHSLGGSGGKAARRVRHPPTGATSRRDRACAGVASQGLQRPRRVAR